MEDTSIFIDKAIIPTGLDLAGKLGSNLRSLETD
jgi:hypothetical protein